PDNLLQPFAINCSVHLTRSVRRTGGFVLTGKPETIDSSVGLVPINALVLTRLAKDQAPARCLELGRGPNAAIRSTRAIRLPLQSLPNPLILFFTSTVHLW
ncbi:MAG: hypothetical protein DMG48_15020, partial [Acidobacteria bacterium]